MANIKITTNPTGRSPENKYFFGEKTRCLDTTRPKYNKIGEEKDFLDFYDLMKVQKYLPAKYFETVGTNFVLFTNDNRHYQFVNNMFKNINFKPDHTDWTIYHNTDLEMEPKIYVHLDKKIMLIGGTTFLGEIKKGVFGIVSFELPRHNILPMHCGAFTYRNTTNLMFGLSGTGKTTLSSDPDYMLISDDEVAWTEHGIRMIETGCYAKSEGLSPETHKTIFDAVEFARNRSIRTDGRLENCLIEENPDAANARLSYPISCVTNAYHERANFDHANNIFFLTMDAEGKFPGISRISGDAVRRFFETGYTSQMPGTEAGSNEIKKTFSPCYGSPFMPREVKVYTDMLMEKIYLHACNVFLVNSGMDRNGNRFPLPYTRDIIKRAILNDYPLEDTSDNCLEILNSLL